MQNREKAKKLIIIFLSLILFGVSYYYYAFKQKKYSNKPIQISKQGKKLKSPIQKTVSGEFMPARKIANIANKKDQKVSKKIIKDNKKDNLKIHTKKIENIVKMSSKITSASQKNELQSPTSRQIRLSGFSTPASQKKIKPTDKSKLIKIASGLAGKNDPFSYTESNFNPFMTQQKNYQGANNLPSPPAVSGNAAAEKTPADYVEIKGFLGNKVLLEINGFTDSLGAGETLRGVKVLSINPQNLSCEFEIKNKKITKKMKPLIQQNKNMEIKYISN